MRSIWRTLDQRLLRDVAAVAAGAAVSGASFGAISVAAGLPWWLPVVMSLLVFAGGSQFMAVGIVAAGGSPAAAVLAGLVLNARHLPFGLAVGDVLGRGLVARLVGSHLLIDETVAFALAQRDPARARAAYWSCGVALFGAWNASVVAGALAGQAIGDPAAFGLDAAFPAALLALTLPALKDRKTRHAALLGSAVALATTPFLPAGLPVLLALGGLVVAFSGKAVRA
ncbi:4-azaleucine resistance transporter AzlC [Saccharothrix tamanrassetensis]|uniref:4-azaleucine resistance transporter AzlC n=1 Tax=Saccharothrix tamanrassetensis TaxID=1051531 RepID=A0A841CER2_9PSEU|nr:AzlC family ABC transporter permease [Saccharothrix tamanrassetensis]MBB5954226.1 4-azaleucine resistance transporter AzlC [Saccharothrix tamanrassetensis]